MSSLERTQYTIRALRVAEKQVADIRALLVVARRFCVSCQNDSALSATKRQEYKLSVEEIDKALGKS